MKDSELKDFGQTISEASKASGAVPDEPISLEDRRIELKDLLGGYRTSAEILCNSFKGRDARLERELRVGNSFPNNDTKLRAYGDGLAAVVRKHSTKLAERGFGKAEQQQLEKAIADFGKALAMRGKERGEARSAILTRDAALETLRLQTAYFRRIGRAALKTDSSRSDFDRVAREPRRKVTAPPTAA